MMKTAKQQTWNAVLEVCFIERTETRTNRFKDHLFHLIFKFKYCKKILAKQALETY